MSLEDHLKLLKLRKAQWESEHVQAFLKTVTIEVEALQKLGLKVTKAGVQRNPAFALKLEELGLEPPETPSDALQIYVALRCVLNFWTGNLDRLKADSLKAIELEKQLAREANDSLGR